jgi:inositol-phosphate phosphatase/L-galactose 1-phosphate phosphatase/histidinol-phosphatase
LDLATLYTTAPEWFKGADQTRYEALRRQVRLFRYGADCYAFGLLALGFVDLVVESDMNVYDYFALIPVIEGAGGVITDWQGRALGLESDGRVVAAGDKSLHTQALDALKAP